MKKRLTADGVPTPRGGRWDYAAIIRILKVACHRRDMKFTNRARVGGVAGPKYPAAVRNLVYELGQDGSVSWGQAVADLNAMGYRTYTGKLWTEPTAQQLYSSECARRGEKPVGRTRALPENVERLVETRRRAGESRDSIAQWLNTLAVRRPNGKPWDATSVSNILSRRRARLTAET